MSNNVDSHPRPRTALIIGGGIGGPVAAMALQRAGLSPVVFEAAERTAPEAGAFLNLACNGLAALRTVDAEASVVAHGFATPRIVMSSASGKVLGEVENGVRPDGITSLSIRRGALHAALHGEAERRGVRFEHGRRLVAAQVGPGGVTARFDDGSVVLGDLLVGADGLHSATRTLIDRDAPLPRFTGQLSVGGFAHGVDLPPTPDAFHMIFGRRGFFGYSVRPSGEVWWFGNLAWPDEPARGALAAIPSAEWRRRLHALYDGDRGPQHAILDATGHDLAAYPIHDLRRVPAWHRGPMVILGDAAHAASPSSGQGAAMAIEDAVVLGRCLRDHAELSRAFAAYEAQRRGRVERVVAYAARIDHSKAPGPIGRWFRDRIMPFALRRFASPEAQAWLHRYSTEDAAAS